jgi:single-stranded DNA-binding protein
MIVAVPRCRGHGAETDFISVVAWGNVAETVRALGNEAEDTMVLIDGVLHTHSYIDDSGHKQYVTEVAADYIDIIERKVITVEEGEYVHS